MCRPTISLLRIRVSSSHPLLLLSCREVEAPPSFVDVVGGSEEAVTKQMQAVASGVTSIVEKVQQVRQLGRG